MDNPETVAAQDTGRRQTKNNTQTIERMSNIVFSLFLYLTYNPGPSTHAMTLKHLTSLSLTELFLTLR